MPNQELSSSESRSMQLRRLMVPDWLWQLSWLRHLPRYHREVLWNECKRSRFRVTLDLLTIFFKLKIVPEHYGPCRLWEKSRDQWVKYYGSPYTPVQRRRIARRIYPFDYQIVYNDKMVGAQLCEGLDVKQPTIFGVLEPDQPYREQLTQFFRSSGKSRLMLKPIYGRSGIGIVLAELNDGGIVVRTGDGAVALSEFRLELPVFVQEVIQQDARMASIWGSSVNTVRVITLQTLSGEVLIVGCAFRMGVGKAFVDNWSAGGVAVGVEPQSGRLRKYGYDYAGNRYTQHPTSQVTFEGFQIPQWQSILETARAVQRKLPFSKLAGFDICLDQDGTPVLIEINGLPDFVMPEQLNGPLLADRRILKAFAEYDLLVSGAQRGLLQAESTSSAGQPDALPLQS